MSWFTPKCPIDTETKEWLENSFNWLIEELGLETLQAVAVILPTEQFFPDPFSGSHSDIRAMLNRVCEYMEVDHGEIEVRFYINEDGTRLHPLAAPESSEGHALGTYQMRKGKYLISLETSQASNPEVMVATIAHELGHVILLGENRLDPDYADHEPMTDLLTVFYGMGIFNANSVFTFEQWTNTHTQGWQANRRGYMTEEMFGYALAMFAHSRGEQKPQWANFLRTNVRTYMKNSLKYIQKTGDTAVIKASEKAQ